MTSAVMRLDLSASRTRTRWSMATSLVVHALVLLWMILAPQVVGQMPALTEIVLLEPGEPAAARGAAGPARGERSEAGAAARHEADATFRRADRRAEITPEPDSPGVLEDRIAVRLATLQRSEPAPVRRAAAPAERGLWGTPAPGPGSGPGKGPPLALHRGGSGSGSGPALALERSGAGFAPALATGGPRAETAAAASPARGGEATVRRSLAGATLAGPIADRPVLAHVLPAYPEWAKQEAVEGSVSLYFVVRPDGTVRENVLVQKTAGFEDFDENARTALRAWRFAPLREGRTGEQWGTITFHFRLREVP